MERIAEDGAARAHFNDLAEIHDGHAVADALNDAHVVRDEDIGKSHFLLQFHHQVHHLSTDGDVERGNAFIGHDDLGFERKRTGNTDALTLTAGEFMRVAVSHVRGESHALKEQRYAVVHLLFGAVVVDHHRLGNRVAHGLPRVERGVRILEDHLQIAALFLKFVPGHAQQRLAAVEDFTAVDIEQPQNGAASG